MKDKWVNSWHPVASLEDMPYRHVFQGQLLGRELALWRSDDDFVNVWENRCLHRGSRLTIGTTDGRELKCQYHGWRYASRSAGCTYIPAHPADAPARTICNRTFPAVEKYGLIWTGEDPEGSPPEIGELNGEQFLALRGIAVNAPLDFVLTHLADYRFSPDGDRDELGSMLVEEHDERSLILTAAGETQTSKAVFFVQPVDSERSVIRGVISGVAADEDCLHLLRHHSAELASLRDFIESQAADLPPREPMVATIEQAPVASVELPSPSGQKAPLRVQVVRKWTVAEEIVGLELESIGEPLPTHQSGAHIDVHLPNGLIRQYSLVNAPGDGSTYILGVKLETASKGGSACIHETVREGDVLAISEPRNKFPLRRDAVKTMLIAGGIGATPLLSMAQALQRNKLEFAFHYFAQSKDHLAFAEIRDELGNTVTPHLGLTPEETERELQTLLAEFEEAMHLYLCGPGPMLETARRIASEAGWPDESVHFEYFKNTTEIDDSSSFEISLARSALTLQVPEGKSILEVLRENGVLMQSSCEQGACGTCEVAVIEGELLHQDVYLNESEKSSGQRIMTCVSRAKSSRLILDI